MVGIIDKMHPYTTFIETLLLETHSVGMHLVYYPPYHSCFRTF